MGFAQADAISKVAAEFPDTKFSIIDVSWLDAPNLRQYAFKEHEGSYIVGVAAAKASKTGKVGVVGGMDIGLIAGSPAAMSVASSPSTPTPRCIRT